MSPKLETVNSFTKYFTDEVPEGAKDILLGIILGWISRTSIEGITGTDDKQV